MHRGCAALARPQPAKPALYRAFSVLIIVVTGNEIVRGNKIVTRLPSRQAALFRVARLQVIVSRRDV